MKYKTVLLDFKSGFKWVNSSVNTHQFSIQFIICIFNVIFNVLIDLSFGNFIFISITNVILLSFMGFINQNLNILLVMPKVYLIVIVLGKF